MSGLERCIPFGVVLLCASCASAGLETALWQAAIDAAGRAGGGVVTIPAGRHLVGQLDLRSNVELHLEDGAVLEGAVGMEHYRRTTLPYSEGTWSAVVFALGVTNVAVTGRGEIFGNGVPWPTPKSGGGNQEGLRPRGLFFGDSANIRLSDFTLRDAACWGIVLKCCDGVDVRRVRVDNHANHNNDGIDVEAKNVVIADCDIDSGDDAIVLKSNNPHFAVENVLVTNVTAKSYCNCLKFGTASHGIMRNVLFVDCRTGAPRRDFEDRVHGGGSWYFNNARRNARFPGSIPGYAEASSGITVQNVDGGLVENVVYRNITVEGVRVPIFIRGGARTGRDCGTPPSEMRTLRNILIENVRGTAGSWLASSITGVRSCRVRNVVLRNVHIVCRGAGDSAAERDRPVPENEGNYPDPDIFRCMLPAWGLYARHVDGLTLDNVTFELRSGETDARERYVFDDVTRLVGNSGPGTYFVPPEGTANVTDNGGTTTGGVKRTVAFLGGSITEMNGYRPRVMRALRAKYPQVAFVEIAAGLSSTCSDAGAFRLEEDVLSKGTPDLFVVEAAVNDDQDGHFSFDKSVRGMEGSVRRVLTRNPACAVVVGLMVNVEQYQQLTNGVTPLQYAAHAHVARHYGAAIADVGSALAKVDDMTWEDYRDCHPSPLGCDLGARIVLAAVNSVFDPNAKPVRKTLPPPIDENSYFNGHAIPFERIERRVGWQVSRPPWETINGQKRSYFIRGQALWTEKADSEFEFSFFGTSAAAFLTAGPDAGKVEVSVDGASFKALDLRAEFGALHYPYVQFLADDLEMGRHVIRVRSSAAQREAGVGTAVRIHRLYVNGK